MMYPLVENKDERMWGMLCHLSALAGCIIPLGNVIGPLIVYSMKKDEYSFVADQGKESLNFQLSVLLYILISIVSIFILIGPVFLIIIPIISFIYTIVASIRANDGEYYRYPLCIHFIK